MSYVGNLAGANRVLKTARAKILASVAVAGLLAGGLAIPTLAETPAPANAKLTTTYANSGYADLVEAVKPAVVNVRVERAADGDAARGPMGPNMDPEMRRWFFERFFGEPGGPGGPRSDAGAAAGSAAAARRGLGLRHQPRRPRRHQRPRGRGADRITVLLDDGTELDGHGEGVDEKTDLALVKVDAGKPPPLRRSATAARCASATP